MTFVITRTSNKSSHAEANITTFADLKEKVDEMKREADKLLQVTKELHEIISIPWIK